MKILLGKSVLFENQEVDTNQFLAGVEYETAQLKLRFPDHTEIVGCWKNNRSKYVLYCVEEIYSEEGET